MKIGTYKLKPCSCGSDGNLKFSEFTYHDQVRFMVVCDNCGTAQNAPEVEDTVLLKKLLVRSAICANANTGSLTMEDAAATWNGEKKEVVKKKRQPKIKPPKESKPPKDKK